MEKLCIFFIKKYPWIRRNLIFGSTSLKKNASYTRVFTVCIFQMIWFYGLLAGNNARTEVLPLPITRFRPISGPSWFIELAMCRR